jgi:hypothetical protein
VTIYEILLLACKTAQEGRKPQQNRKRVRRASTGYLGQDTQVRITVQYLLDRTSAKTLREKIIGS